MAREKEFVIYTLSHPITKEVRYVGWTSRGMKVRLSCHIATAKRGTEKSHKNNWIRHLLKDGLTPVMEVLEVVSIENYAEKERNWIKFFGRRNLVNGTDGGDGVIGYRHTKKSKEKMSKARKGKKLSLKTIEKMSGENNHNYGKSPSPETKEKMSNSHKKNGLVGEKHPMWGKKLSQETRSRMSKSSMGRMLSEKTKKKLSDINKGENNPNWGKKRSLQTVEKMSGKNHPMWGKTHNLEARKKITDAQIGKKRTLGSSKYVGAVLNKKTMTWRTAIRLDGKSKYLGTYKSEILAAQNYDLALLRYYEGKSPSNFIELENKYRKLIREGVEKIREEIK